MFLEDKSKLYFVFALTLISLFQISVALSYGYLNPTCVVYHIGQQSCTMRTEWIPASAPQKDILCSPTDLPCWCLKAVESTKALRRRHGRAEMFKRGKIRQLGNNAIWYAQQLFRKPKVVYHNFDMARSRLGFHRSITTENIEYHYDNENIALPCVNQWEKAASHVGIIVNSTSEKVHIGLYQYIDGRLCCIPTLPKRNKFSSEANESGPKCMTFSLGRNKRKSNFKVTNKLVNGEKKHGFGRYFAGIGITNNEVETDSRYKGSPLLSIRRMIPQINRLSQKREMERNEKFVECTGGKEKSSNDRPGSDISENKKAKEGNLVRPRARHNKKEHASGLLARRQGNVACRCLGAGKACWYSLGELSGHSCRPFTKRNKQSMACQLKCCRYCLYLPKSYQCIHKQVTRLCQRIVREMKKLGSPGRIH